LLEYLSRAWIALTVGGHGLSKGWSSAEHYSNKHVLEDGDQKQARILKAFDVIFHLPMLPFSIWR
jgi:hypothetical protein